MKPATKLPPVVGFLTNKLNAVNFVRLLVILYMLIYIVVYFGVVVGILYARSVIMQIDPRIEDLATPG